VRFEARRRGARAYLALDGGLALTAVPGQPVHRSGERALAASMAVVLQAGDRVPVEAPPAGRRGGPSGPPATQTALRPLPSGGARVRVLPGPHGEWFSPAAFDRLCRTRYEVTPESNRMGYRLRGAEPLPREAGEMISDATCAGGLQVPPSGQPILLLADRQVTAAIRSSPPSSPPICPSSVSSRRATWIEFDACTRADALAALAGLDAADGARA
jgi:allophanate hydrolase subunit 2